MTTITPTPTVIDGVEWVRPRPDAPGLRGDVVLAAVLFGGMLVSLVLFRAAGTYDDAQWWQSILCSLGMAAPLVVRRRFPEVVAVVVSVVYAIGIIGQMAELLISQIALFISVYTVGAWGRSRTRANIVRGAIVVAMFAWLFWQIIYLSAVQDYLPDVSRTDTGDSLLSPYVAYGAIQILTNLLFFGGAWYFGDAAYRSARGRAALEQLSAELASERERTAAQAVALERLRIARELHDVVAHHVSVMGVQAGAARRVLDRDPAAAAASLSAIETSARSAVDELHQLLGTLRDDPSVSTLDSDADRASTHGIDQLPALIAEAASAGLAVDYAVIGDPRPVPATVSLTVYRVTQEALTNVRKHGGSGVLADVRLRYLDGAVEVEIANAGATRTSTARTTGLGLVGMRERADAVGGVVEAGPRSRGGWLVRAHFPLASAPGPAEDDA
ncbi:MAG: histidine kinase [Leifsonia sp.]